MYQEIVGVVTLLTVITARQLDVRAPAIANPGSLHLISCSITAQELDDTLALVWGIRTYATWNSTNDIGLGVHAKCLLLSKKQSHSR